MNMYIVAVVDLNSEQRFDFIQANNETEAEEKALKNYTEAEVINTIDGYKVTLAFEGV